MFFASQVELICLEVKRLVLVVAEECVRNVGLVHYVPEKQPKYGGEHATLSVQPYRKGEQLHALRFSYSDYTHHRHRHIDSDVIGMKKGLSSFSAPQCQCTHSQ